MDRIDLKARRLAAWLFMAALPAMCSAATPPRLPEALDSQRRALEANPGDAGALNDLGNLLLLAGEIEEARESYLRAASLAPDEPRPLYNLALLHQELAHYPRAIKLYRRVLALEPDHALAHYRLGTLQADRGRNPKAVRHLARAFSLDPTLALPEHNPEVLFNDLTTWAAMAAYLAPTPARAARSYNDPTRITDLLLPDLEAMGPEEEQQSSDEAPTETAPADPGNDPGGEDPEIDQPGSG